MTDDAVALIDRVDDSSFFLFVNYMDAHDPYAPPLSSLPRCPLRRHPARLLATMVSFDSWIAISSG